MICPRCGNNITKFNRQCRCGLIFNYDSESDEFRLDITSLKNDSLKELLRNMAACVENNESFDVYVPQLIYDIKNAILVIGINEKGEEVGITGCFDDNGKEFAMLFTSLEEYDKCRGKQIKSDKFTPRGLVFEGVISLLHDNTEGIVIDVGSEKLELKKDFFKDNYGEYMS